MTGNCSIKTEKLHGLHILVKKFLLVKNSEKRRYILLKKFLPVSNSIKRNDRHILIIMQDIVTLIELYAYNLSYTHVT